MAVSRLSQQSIQQAFPKGNTIWDGVTATSAYDSLGAVYLSATASSVSFTNIPSTYTHLQIRATSRTDRAVTYTSNVIRFNSDTTNTNYSQHELFGNGTAVSAGGGANSAFYTLIPGTSTTASVFEGDVIDILDYANTNKYKTVRILSGYDGNGSGVIFFGSGSWRNTAAISSISLTATSGNIVQYSQFSLYGIK